MQMNCKLLPLISSTNRSSLTHKKPDGQLLRLFFASCPQKISRWNNSAIFSKFTASYKKSLLKIWRFFFIFANKSGELFIVSLNVVLGYCTPCWEFAEHFNAKYTYAYRESAQSTVLWSRADYFIDKRIIYFFASVTFI